MIPALQADESMLTAQRLAVGGGHLEPRTATQILERWERTAARESVPAGRPRLPPRTAKELTAHIAETLGVDLPKA